MKNHTGKTLVFLLNLTLMLSISACGPRVTTWPVVTNDHLEIQTSAALPSATAAATSLPSGEGIIQFSGYAWTVRENGLSGPGPNIWSRDNVWVDEAGDLHLKITHTENGWQCA